MMFEPQLLAFACSNVPELIRQRAIILCTYLPPISVVPRTPTHSLANDQASQLIIWISSNLIVFATKASGRVIREEQVQIARQKQYAKQPEFVHCPHTRHCSSSTIMEEPRAVPGQIQPWRQHWPPKDITASQEEQEQKPWVNWKPDPVNPNAKPWLTWVPRDFQNYERSYQRLSGQDSGLKDENIDGGNDKGSSNAEGG